MAKSGFEYKVLSCCELSREVRGIMKYLDGIEQNIVFLNKKVNKLENEMVKLKWKRRKRK